MLDSLWPFGVQHARLTCPSPAPGVYSSSCPLSQWCHQTISSSVIPFSSCHQSVPASGSFPMSESHQVEKYWSFSFSISPSNEHSGLISFRIDWLNLLAVQGTLKGLFQHHSSKASILQHSALLMVQLSHLYKSKKVGEKILYLLDFALKFWLVFSHLISLGFSINKLWEITLLFKGILLTC